MLRLLTENIVLCVCLVGLHIETKDPLFINSRLAALGAGTTFEDLLLQSLVGHGYDVSDPRQPIFIQSFNEQSLRYIGNRTNVRLPLVMLLSDNDDLSDDRLRQLAQFAYGIGPYKKSIIRTKSMNQVIQSNKISKSLVSKNSFSKPPNAEVEN